MVLPILNPHTDQTQVQIIGPTIVRPDVLPQNIHGDAEFVVKVQNKVNWSSPPHSLYRELLIYDQARTHHVFVYAEFPKPEHTKLVAILVTLGQEGTLQSAGRKVYCRALRRGGQLIVYLDRLPSQNQLW